jgi:integrase
MPRPRSPYLFHVYDNPRSSIWYVWYRKDPLSDKRTRISTSKLLTGALSKSDYPTEYEAQEVVNKAVQPMPREKLKFTVNWALKYIEDRIYAEGKQDKTLEWYKCSLKKFREAYGGNYRLLDFKPTQIWEFQERCLGDCKPVTVNTYCRGMQGVFNRLRKSGQIEKNPFAEFERMREGKYKKRHLTLEELRKFMKVVDETQPPIMAKLIRILAMTGFRRSEVLLIRREDIDLKNNSISILNIKSHDKHRHGLLFADELKPLFSYFLDMDDSPLPFKRVHPNTITHAVKKCLVAAGLPEFHCHSLRHTHATLSLLSGVPIRELQKIYDHQSIKTTEIYSHDVSDFYRIPDIKL